MVRSKRLRGCTITTLQDNEPQSDRDDLSPTLNPTSLENQPSIEPEPSEENSQVQESTNIEDDDTLEIIDEQDNLKKKRGLTRAKDVWNLPSGQRIKVDWNKFGQPIKKGGGILGCWLGMVARRGNMCPIHYISWKVMPIVPFKLDIVKMTRSKFFLPRDDKIETWVLKSVGRKWKDYKHELKSKYKTANRTQEEIASDVPPEIVPQQWIDLVRNWFSERNENLSRIGRASRASHTTPHTTGSKSFARKRYEFEEENNREPGRIEFFCSNS
ncbi:uncharacterized protein LOC109722927 isoform X1 [Ananas comosus]|uniref:Uncharacterized protein LOC109722927 isoform X1 n=1 Tax=Ananas comosus TaxID=4615 RepID=A0A6P5GMW1_ANACO|nr:uncharacterized protein LOC109722927 isoform X1 [Ananas comosus]